jgi:hypothetical protein
MRLVNGRYECAHCGAVLDVDASLVPTVMFHAAGGQPNMRVIRVDGREVHRCEVRDREPERTST